MDGPELQELHEDRRGDAMSRQLCPKFYRQRFILTFLKQAGGSLSKMDFQKLLFLAHREVGFSYYDFVPYYYGCYSFQAASDLEILQSLGWLELREKDIKLLHNLPVDKGLKVSEIDKLSRFLRSRQGLTSRKLVRYVYEHYPYYAVKSRMARDVLSADAFERVANERDCLQRQDTALFTIGYEGISFEEYMNMLLRNDIRLLCDVRKNPISRKYGFSKGSMSNLLPKVGIEYLHIPELGIVSSNRKNLKTEGDYQRLFAEYKKTILQKKPSLLKLMKLLETHKRIALTCFEQQPSFCHRHCISDYLEAEKAVKVIHL